MVNGTKDTDKFPLIARPRQWSDQKDTCSQAAKKLRKKPIKIRLFPMHKLQTAEQYESGGQANRKSKTPFIDASGSLPKPQKTIVRVVHSTWFATNIRQ
jgi:hypothetical protein